MWLFDSSDFISQQTQIDFGEITSAFPALNLLESNGHDGQPQHQSPFRDLLEGRQAHSFEADALLLGFRMDLHVAPLQMPTSFGHLDWVAAMFASDDDSFLTPPSKDATSVAFNDPETYDTTLDPDLDGFFMGDYFADSTYASWVCGTTLGDFLDSFGWVECDDAIVVQGPTWESVDLGNGASLRFFSNGATAYYVNGEYISDVQITSVTATNGTPDIGLTAGTSSGFSYSANDSQTYNFEFTERYN